MDMKTTLTLRADRTLLRADAESRRHVLVELRAPEAPPRAHRLPVNLAFVIDRSGLIRGEKIANARKAVIQGIRSLRECDRFAVAAYDTEVNLVVASTAATGAARDAGVAAVEQVFPRGGTDLHAGWSAGCEQVSKHLTKDAVARCLLLTDGLANEGVTDHDEIVRQCAGSTRGSGPFDARPEFLPNSPWQSSGGARTGAAGIDFGPGYRIYFDKDGLARHPSCWGHEERPKHDIVAAHARWKDCKQRKPQEKLGCL